MKRSSARINPAALTKSALPAHLRRWFDEAHTVYLSDASYAYKTGYLHGLIVLLEAEFTAQAQARP